MGRRPPPRPGRRRAGRRARRGRARTGGRTSRHDRVEREVATVAPQRPHDRTLGVGQEEERGEVLARVDPDGAARRHRGAHPGAEVGHLRVGALGAVGRRRHDDPGHHGGRHGDPRADARAVAGRPPPGGAPARQRRAGQHRGAPAEQQPDDHPPRRGPAQRVLHGPRRALRRRGRHGPQRGAEDQTERARRREVRPAPSQPEGEEPGQPDQHEDGRHRRAHGRRRGELMQAPLVRAGGAQEPRDDADAVHDGAPARRAPQRVHVRGRGAREEHEVARAVHGLVQRRRAPAHDGDERCHRRRPPGPAPRRRPAGAQGEQQPGQADGGHAQRGRHEGQVALRHEARHEDGHG